MEEDFFLPRAGSAHSLYSSGVQYGASPAAKTKHTHIKKCFPAFLVFEVCRIIYLWSVIDVTLTQHLARVLSYQACAPCDSCSCPPGSVFHSQCDRLWCCNYQRSLNPWASPYSLPTVGGDISAATTTHHKSQYSIYYMWWAFFHQKNKW